MNNKSICRITLAMTMMLFLPCVGNLGSARAQIVEVTLTPNDNNDWKEDGPRRSPLFLPIVTFDNATATLAFEATAGMVFTYEIVDANDDVIATDIVNLAYGQSQSVILTDLEEGVYTIIIYINGCEYEGEFEK